MSFFVIFIAADDDAVHHGFDIVDFVAIHFDGIFKVVHLSIDAYAQEAGFLNLIQNGLMGSFSADPETEKPFVILLDLNMPRMSGIEFLRIIKMDETLKTIPVIVLTTSKEKRDVLDSFELGAAGYMVKPVDYTKFVEVLSTVMLYWTSSELPKLQAQMVNTQ